MFERGKKMVLLLKEAKIKYERREIKCTKNSLFYCPVNGEKFITWKNSFFHCI